MVLFFWSQCLPQILIFLPRCGVAEGEKLCSVELLDVEAHDIILVLNGKQPQETNGSGSRKASSTVSKAQIKLSELSAVRELSPASPADTKLFHTCLQLEVAGLLKGTKVAPPGGQRRGPALRKEVNIFFSYFLTVQKLFHLTVLTCDIQTFPVLQLRRLGCKPRDKDPLDQHSRMA